jgi:DNA mismatch repair protein MutS
MYSSRKILYNKSIQKKFLKLYKKMKTDSKRTPLMQQYFDLKVEHPDSLLLFQVGDFYEIFHEDAQQAARFLGITLTSRGKSVDGEAIPLCGFPIQSMESYVARLVKGGFKVAVCDQLEAAVAGKMVARGITQVFTPGTLYSDSVLDQKSASYLFSFFPTRAGYGLLFSELLTSKLYATVINHDDKMLDIELHRFLPDEILLPIMRGVSRFNNFFKERGFFVSSNTIEITEDLLVEEGELLLHHFHGASAQLLKDSDPIRYAAIVWKRYLEKHQKNVVDQCREIVYYEPDQFLKLDAVTQKNLDLVKNSFDGSRNYTLFSCMDRAVTPMGSRKIREWLLKPLMNIDRLIERQEVISSLINSVSLFTQIKTLLKDCGDMQRIVGRIALDRASLQDYAQLSNLLQLFPQLYSLMQKIDAQLVQEFVVLVPKFEVIANLLKKSINDSLEEKILIKKGFNEELDHLRNCVEKSSEIILELEARERNQTGINSLKIRHNNVHGYYIELTNTHKHLAPEEYIRRQTLVNGERFTTAELQSLQFEIMNAAEKVKNCEQELFNTVKSKVQLSIHDLRLAAEKLAAFDALIGFTQVAYERGYVKPEFHGSRDIIIQDGKHPLVHAELEEAFVPNDTVLVDEASFWIITGPNMGGKSTYLRQVALISLLAQAGSFVPATRAQLPILDRIFTRIGAGDHLAKGKSTFLVEMEETAHICLEATKNSLVILDEVGRGTSTYDGLALAQAIVEYLYEKVEARALFATHYHELTGLQEQHSGIVSFYADSRKTESGVVLLHKIVRGVADGSFGIEVARRAHLPEQIIERARVLLLNFESQQSPDYKNNLPIDVQKNLIEKKPSPADWVYQELTKISFDNISPKQAFDFLWDMKKHLQ